MFFQISPVTNKKPKKQDKREPEEIAVLQFVPFTAIPKICFEDVKPGSTVTKQMIVKNPTSQDMEVHVTRLPPEERHLTLSWHEQYIRAGGEALLELQWCPDTVGGWRDTVTFDGGHRLKKDVAVTFKSVASKKPKVKTNRPSSTVLSSKIKLPTKKIPKKITIKSPPKKLTSPVKIHRPPLTNLSQIPSIIIESPQRRGTYTIRDKENFNIETLQVNYDGGVLVTPKTSALKNIRARNLRCDTCGEDVGTDVLQHNKEKKFDDSLEMSSPDVDFDTRVTDSCERKEKFYLHTASRVMIEDNLKELGFTPVHGTPVMDNSFIPSACSTEEKYRLYQRNNTYALSWAGQDTENQVNFSSETYTKNDLANISATTYVKGNISSETYTKNISPGTYVKDDSLDIMNSVGIRSSSPYSPTSATGPSLNRLRDLTGEKAKNIIEANLWCPEVKRQKLELITEESFASMFTRGTDKEPIRPMRKRKLSGSLDVPCHKLQILDGAKTRSKTTPVKTASRSRAVSNPFILRVTNAVDPFLSSLQLHDLRWIDEQERRFTKWLNALLTPLEELNSKTDEPVNVAKLWQHCKQREVSAAPTKESVSNKYHVTGRLNSLRKAAVDLFKSAEISRVLGEVLSYVDSKKLVMRTDRNIHLDLRLQQDIMLLFLCYNPLWLRIGLETVYGVVIDLSSNSDVAGLSSFISQNFFKDAKLLKKYKSVHAPKYADEIKKFALKKFLVLVYFLDQAKTGRLMAHDPCLFSKRAPIKESREILLNFARDTLAGIGDITKCLKATGFVLTHRQNYIHEYDYAVADLGVDLRDGVRLTRVMEIILLADGLVERLRVPAVSRLQKVHNVKVAFDALENAGFEIPHDLSPKDIVNGHREKTLSFLWHIIYKFEAPRIIKAIGAIQKWWRCLFVVVKRRILTRRVTAAIKIQKCYRRVELGREIERLVPVVRNRLLLAKAAVKIQSIWRMWSQRKRYAKLRKVTVTMQSYARRWLVGRDVKRKTEAVVKIQAFVKGWSARRRYLKQKEAVLKIEDAYVSAKLMVKQREVYRRFKSAVIAVQARFRANKLGKVDRAGYVQLRRATLFVQRRFRANRARRIDQAKYQELERSVLVIQRVFRGKKERAGYLQLRKSVLLVQNWYRATHLMRKERTEYLAIKAAVVFVQRTYRAKKAMAIERSKYERLKNAVAFTQAKFRANRAMKCEKNAYRKLLAATLTVQRLYRAKLSMRSQRLRYTAVKNAAVAIQSWYRATKLMRSDRNYYSSLKVCVASLQRRYRANRLMKVERDRYVTLRNAACVIQTRYRARMSMLVARNFYVRTRLAVITVQLRFRANCLMKSERDAFNYVKNITVLCQRRFRANRLMKAEREGYLLLRRAAVVIQRRFRAWKCMRVHRNCYLRIREAALCVQRKFRANRLMGVQRDEYVKLKICVKALQQRFRATRLMHKERTSYEEMRRVTCTIQNRYRANKRMQIERSYYLRLLQAVSVVQARFRANKLRKTDQDAYRRLKNASVRIQRWYRASKVANRQRQHYKNLREAAMFVQRTFRNNKLMKIEREKYQRLRKAVLSVQARYMANKKGSVQRTSYVRMRAAAVVLQSYFRCYLKMRDDRKVYKLKITTIIKVQTCARRFLLLRKYKEECEPLLKERRRVRKTRNSAATKIQAAWRGYRTRSLEEPALTQVRDRVKKAQETACPEQSLACRTIYAKQVLVNSYESLHRIIEALRVLEFATRVFKDECLSVSKAVPQVLYKLMNWTCRSLPGVTACTLSVSILINFCKYQPSSANAWCPEHVDIVFAIMGHSCDKESLLFPYLCTLVWLFAHNKHHKKAMRGIPKFEQRMSKLRQLCLRKKEMVGRAPVKGVSVFLPYKNLPVPSLEPDWGIDYDCSPRTFTNSVHALKSVLSILDVD